MSVRDIARQLNEESDAASNAARYQEGVDKDLYGQLVIGFETELLKDFNNEPVNLDDTLYEFMEYVNATEHALKYMKSRLEEMKITGKWF